MMNCIAMSESGKRIYFDTDYDSFAFHDRTRDHICRSGFMNPKLISRRFMVDELRPLA